jgi:hypothetical protein
MFLANSPARTLQAATNIDGFECASVDEAEHSITRHNHQCGDLVCAVVTHEAPPRLTLHS